MDDHVAGRCALLPQTKTYAELGIDAPEPEFNPQSGREWFEQQDEATQRKILGSGKYDAWKDGKFTLDDIPHKTPSDVWGDSWTPKSLYELLGESAPVGSYQDWLSKQEMEIPQFNTIQEIEQWAKIHYANNINLNAFANIEHANEFNRTMQRLSDKYGIKIDRIYSYKNQSVYGNIMESGSEREAILVDGKMTGEWRDVHKIGINTKFFNKFSNENDFDDLMSRQFNENWSLSENVSDLITHEYGHILTDKQYVNELIRNGMPEVSKYAGESMSETVAELFLKYTKFGSLPTEQMTILKRYISVEL